MYKKGVYKVAFYEPKKELKTSHYLPNHRVMLQSTHWVNPSNGEHVALSAGLKLYYEYRLQRFNYFTKQGLTYSETNKGCALSLGIGCSTINNKHNPLLKQMGLLDVIRLNDYREEERLFHFEVKTVKDIKGWLINPYFSECKKEVRIFNNDKIDYMQLKILEHNKSLSDKIRHNKSDKFYTISESDRKEYMQLKRELKSIE